MNHGWKLICAALLISTSFSLQAASQHVDLMLAQQFAAHLSSTHDLSTWLLIVAGCVGVVVARKRI